MTETITWLAPSFLWEEALKDTTRERLGQPAMFRFDNDSFMEELAGSLEKDPGSLKDLTARYETWIQKSSGWLSENELKKEKHILKLYQPTHGYFYIAAAMLICRIPGFPDRKIDISNDEKGSFVMRRLVPFKNKESVDINGSTEFTEYGMIEGKGWRKASPSSAAYDEERLPLFPLHFTENNVKRRLLAGLIPVSKKETYQSEPEFMYETSPSEVMDNSDKDELTTAKPAFLELKNKIILACEKLLEYCGYIFCWNGIDNTNIEIKIKSFLEQNYDLYWIKDAKFVKNNGTIKLTSASDQEVLLTRIDETTPVKVKLEINKDKIDTFIENSLNGNLNIYYDETIAHEKTNADEILAREILQNIVLDLDEYLEDYLGVVWKAVHVGWTGGTFWQQDLYNRFGVDFAPGKKWYEILKDKKNIGDFIKNLNIDDIAKSISVLKSNDDFASFLDAVDKALPDKKDARILQFEKYAVKPFAALYADLSGNAARTDEGARKSFLLILLDFAEFLNENLGNVFSAIIKDEYTGLDTTDKVVFSVFKNTVFYGDFNWVDVIKEIWDKRYAAISGKTDSRIISGASAKHIMDAIKNLKIVDNNYSDSSIYIAIMGSLRNTEIQLKPPIQLNIDKTAGALFFLRFVYDRPKCRNISESIVSQPTQMFQLANFYDPDAPSRALKITMPIDTSIEGFKKYPRNVSFVISNKLRSQMEILKGVRLQDIGNPRKKGPAFDLGMVCTFSIPIISICALGLLMAIVFLLNFIFWWLPYFKICFPLKLKLEK